nr:reverse transcriptase domain-containing protein [Tanacetum cinerariifolium]
FDESFHEAWERYKDLLRACFHHGFTELHQLDTFYNALNPADQDSLNVAALNQQTSAVTTAMTAMLKQLQSNPPPAQVKAVEEIYVTCGGAHPYYQCLAVGGNTFPEYMDNIQGYVSAATGNYNQDQDSLNAAAGGNLLEKSPQDALTIIENKSKVRNSRSKPIASPVNACDNHSSSELAKLTHAVNQQTSAVTTAMTAMLKQFQSNPPPAQVKAVEEICVTCRGAHPYYQCLAASGNTFPEYQDNIQGYVSAATGNYIQGNLSYRPQGVANQMHPTGFAQPNVQNNQNQFGQP